MLTQTSKTTIDPKSSKPTTATANKGFFVWYDLLTKDTKAAIAFYTDVAGWKTQPFAEGGDYPMFLAQQGPLGGAMKLDEKMGAPSHWMGHVEVADVDAAAALTKKLGGKVLKEPSDIPKVGRFAVIADPQGASISIFKSSMAMPLHDASKAGEFCWSELMTSDSAASFEFYSEICGWKMLQEMDMGEKGTYRIFGVGDKRLGGMMTIPKEVSSPPAWTYYTETSDLDAAIGRATKLGAKVIDGPMEVPTGARVAQLTDPQGAAFALHQLPKK